MTVDRYRKDDGYNSAALTKPGSDAVHNGDDTTGASGALEDSKEQQQPTEEEVVEDRWAVRRQRCCRIFLILLFLVLTGFALARAAAAIYEAVEVSKENQAQRDYFASRTPRPTPVLPSTPSPTHRIWGGWIPSTKRPTSISTPAPTLKDAPLAFGDQGLGFLQVLVNQSESPDPLCVTWHLNESQMILLECAKSRAGTLNFILFPSFVDADDSYLIQRQVFFYNPLGLQQIALNERLYNWGNHQDKEIPNCLTMGGIDFGEDNRVQQCASNSDAPFVAQWYPDVQGRIRKVGSGSSDGSPGKNSTTDLCLTALLPDGYIPEKNEKYKYIVEMRPCHNHQDDASNTGIIQSGGIQRKNNHDHLKNEYQQFITPPRFWDPLQPSLLTVNRIEPNVAGFLQTITGEGCITNLVHNVTDGDTATVITRDDNGVSYNKNHSTGTGALVVNECLNKEDQLILYHSDTQQIELVSGGCLEWNYDSPTVQSQPCHYNTSAVPPQQRWHHDKEGRIYHYPNTTTRVLCLETAPATFAPSATPVASMAPSTSSERRLRPRQYLTTQKESETSNIFADSGTLHVTQPPQMLITRQPVTTGAYSDSPEISVSGPLQVRTGPCTSEVQNSIYGPIHRQTFTFARPTVGVLQNGTGRIEFPVFGKCLKYFPFDMEDDSWTVIEAVSCNPKSSGDNPQHIFEYNSDTEAIYTSDGSGRCLTAGTLSGLFLTLTCPEWRPNDKGGMLLYTFGCMEYDRINQAAGINRTSCHEEDSQRISWIPVLVEDTHLVTLSQPRTNVPTNAPTNIQPTITASIPRPLSPQSITPGATSGPSWTLDPSTQMPRVTAGPTRLERERPGRNGQV